MLYIIYNFNHKYISDTENKKYVVSVVRAQKITDEQISYIVQLNNTTDKFILNIYKDKFSKEDIPLEKYSKYKYGDVLEFYGKVNIPKLMNNPYEFDYKTYLNSVDMFGIISTYKVEYVDNLPNNYLYKLIYGVKEKINEKLYDKIPKQEAELLKSMLYGDDAKLSDEIKQDFIDIGVSHLISVSGSNILALTLILYWMLKKIRLKARYSNIIVIICLIVFCIFANSQLSVLRATIMSVLLLVTELYDKKINKYLCIFISFILMLIINLYSIFNVGFLLSYAATLSIVMYYKIIYSFFDAKIINYTKFNILYRLKLEKNKFIRKIAYRLLNYINLLLALTIASQILVIPIQVYYFNSMPLASYISNIVIVAISTVQNLLGFITIFSISIPYVSDILINANFVILHLIIYLAKKISELNIPVIYIPSQDTVSTLFYYFIILLNLYSFKLNRKLRSYEVNIKILKEKRIFVSKNKLKILIYVLTTVSITYISIYYIYTIFLENYIYYFNVGQGNMAIVRYNRKVIVIDCGSTTNNIASSILTQFLHKKAIKNIDGIVLTHFHTDHVNAYKKLTENFNIFSLIYSIPKLSNVIEFETIEKISEDKKIRSIAALQYDKIKIDEDFYIDILSPPYNSLVKSSDEMNSNSMVLLLTIKNKNFLFMGDATKETEELLLNDLNNITEEKREILKKLQNLETVQIGHHGSNTSTSEKFLNSIRFKIGIISANKEKYGHPDESIVKLLKRHDILVKITEIDGSIKIKI